MAPSWSDYHGASRGAWLAGSLLLVVTLLLAAVDVNANTLNNAFIGLTGPLYAILGLTVLLCAIAAFCVYALTFFIPRFYQLR
jgi:hypothetical protein